MLMKEHNLAGVGPTIAGGALTPVIQDNAGLLQELTHRGIPEGNARYYEDQFRRGKTLVLAADDTRSAEAADIMHRRGSQANLEASNIPCSQACRRYVLCLSTNAHTRLAHKEHSHVEEEGNARNGG
jgi:hypothetical protein